MTHYYVQKEGVYYHGVYGIYTDHNEAIKRCQECADNDIDNYHSWIVYEYVSGNKDEPIYECKKGDNK